MPEPKVVKGWLGWAVIGDGLTVYAKTKKEAIERYRLAEHDEANASDAPVEVLEAVNEAPDSIRR